MRGDDIFLSVIIEFVDDLLLLATFTCIGGLNSVSIDDLAWPGMPPLL